MLWDVIKLKSCWYDEVDIPCTLLIKPSYVWYDVAILFWLGISIPKLGPLNWGRGAGNINLSKLISKIKGLIFSFTTHKLLFSWMDIGNGWYSLNRIS